MPACVAVLATGEALTYLPAQAAPAAHLRRYMRRVSKALISGGLFIFDAIVEGDSTWMTRRTWVANDDWAVLVDIAENGRRHVVTRRITTFTRIRGTYRRTDAEHRVGVYDRSQVLRELRASGFRARTQRGYDATPLLPRRLVFLAQRIEGD
jgi:hypothetical protein